MADSVSGLVLKSFDERDLFRAVIDSLPDNVYVKDAEGRYLVDNITHARFIGRDCSQIINHTVYDLFEKELADRYHADDVAIIHTGRPLLGREEPITGPDGGRRWVSTSKVPLRDGSGKIVALVCISSDITRRRIAEDQLREQNVRLQELAESERFANDALRAAQAQMVQAEKLAALGQLVAGVAHEINNPLSFVTNNLAVMQRDCAAVMELLQMYRDAEGAIGKTDPAALAAIHEKADQIDVAYIQESVPETITRSREGLKRIRQIVADLRDFARQDTIGELQPSADLNTGIESTMNIIRGRAKRTQVELEADLSPLPGVTCDPARINQVIMNLVANAIDACPSGGKVIVRSRPVDDQVEIQIIDTGTGIPPEIRDRIFNPFFTTKPQGHGTGLGLSISHGIIADHKGVILVDSEPGKGTTFTVRLPLAPPKADERKA